MRGRVLLGLVTVEIIYLIGGGFIFWVLENSPVASGPKTNESQTPVANVSQLNVSQLLQLVDSYMGQCPPV
jgi:hypothetical protein